jgi:hypothetical protein
VVFPLFDESQRHDFTLTGIQKFHPMHELEGRRPGLGGHAGEAIDGVFHIHSLDFARLLAIVATQSVVRNPEKPCVK